jgi:hypothetical protein
MFLIIASLLLLAVIAYQNYSTPQLRQLTISDGLYQEVPTFWMLDGAYVVLATALVMAFKGHGLAEVLAWAAAGSLMITAISNTFSVWVDKVTKGLHNKIHTYFSLGMFVSMLGVQAVSDSGKFWWLSAAGLAAPILVAGMLTVWKKLGVVAGPAAEKTAVLFLCVWLIVWSLTP